MKQMKTKRYYILVITALVLILTGCSSKDLATILKFKEYNVGEEVTIDGIIYQYVDFMDKTNQYKPFSFDESNEDVIMHTFYYYDMVNESQIPITGYDSQIFHGIENLDMIARATDPRYNYQSDQYYPLQVLLYGSQIDQSGFVVRGYTEKIGKEVTIKDSIDRNPVVAIGYKAFSGAKMEKLSLNHKVVLLPYAVSECPNLLTIDFRERPILLSCAIANNPVLVKVGKIGYLSDACLYNLKELKEVEIDDVEGDYSVYPFFHSGILNEPTIDRYPNVRINKRYGVYKAPFYLCEKLTTFSGKVIVRNNVVYASYYYIDEQISYSDPVYVMDDFTLDYLNFNTITGIANHQDKSLIPNILITGYPINGTINVNLSRSYYSKDESNSYFDLSELLKDDYLSFIENLGPYVLISNLTNFYD